MIPIEKAADLDFWSGPVSPIPLGGGRTNTNFTVDHKGERYVVRIGEDIPIHGVMRFNELAAAKAAYMVGVAPQIVYHTEGALRVKSFYTRSPDKISFWYLNLVKTHPKM